MRLLSFEVSLLSEVTLSSITETCPWGFDQKGSRSSYRFNAAFLTCDPDLDR